MALIECRNITKVYGSGDNEVTVLKGLALDIKKGEFVAITGPSGSGKSTLMHILGALDSPTDGTYSLNNKNISAYTEDELAQVRGEEIGFVFQAFNLLPRSTVLRNVELPLIYSEHPPEDREKRAREALLAAGMDESKFLNKSNQISGGQMQRVAIARALVNDPSIILADEPTGNLDQKTGEIVLDTLRKLHREGRTIVLITHDMYVAQTAERIIQIRDGEIVSDAKNKTQPKRQERS